MAASDDKAMKWGDALQDLLIGHTPFQPTETEDFQELTRQFSALERLFIDHPRLQPYYAACMGMPVSAAVDSPEPWETVNAASMQIQLMEDAFFSMRLFHYANAPDNRGWLNLFRSWARYERFRQHFDDLSANFSGRFVAFYKDYIENWEPIDDAPVPHAWDLAPRPPDYELATEEDLLPEEWERWQKDKGRDPEKVKESYYSCATVRSMKNARRRSAGNRQVKGLYLDRGRREAGTPYGRPAGRHRDDATPIEGEHSEAPRQPPAKPV